MLRKFRKALAIVMMFALCVSAGIATTLTIPNSFTAGTGIQSVPVNQNFTAIANWANGNIDNSNIASGAAINPTKLDLTREFPVARAAASRCFSAANTGDTVNRWTMTSDGTGFYGPGGSSALDTSLKRLSAATLAVMDGVASAYGTLVAATHTWQSAANKLIQSVASIATADRTLTWRDPGANVDGVYATSGATATAGGLAYGTGSSTLNYSAAGSTGQIALSGSSGAPTWLGSGSSGQLLQSGGAAAPPTWTTSATIGQGGTNNGALSVAQGTVYYGDGTKLVGLAPGNSGYYLQTQGASANPVWAPGGGGWTVNAKSTGFTASGNNQYYRCSASLTATLPAATGTGNIYMFKATATSALITFSFNGSDKVIHANGAQDQSLTLNGYQGTLWLIDSATGFWDEI